MSVPAPAPRQRSLAGLARRMLAALLNVYGAFLLVYLLLRMLVGEGFLPVGVASQVLHLLLLPAFIGLPLACWLRRWPAAVICGLGAGLFLVLFGPLFLPRNSAPPDDAAPILTVLAYNVEGGRDTTADALAAALRRSDADIIGLVEFGAWLIPGLARNMRDAYPYQALDAVPTKGLLSRYPILAVEAHDLSSVHVPTLVATLEVDGAPLRVIVTHVVPKGFGPGAAAEIDALADLAMADGPAILMGDFNMTDQSDNYTRLVDAGLTDAFRAAGQGFGFTWPTILRGTDLAVQPLLRIDFIFHTPHFDSLRAWVGPAAGSDHLPVLADLAWVDDGP
jgi:endonuclease/exonuclease/phosphatase (EEP) superfamily protein YafD